MIDRRHMPRQDVSLEGAIHVPLRPPLPAFISNISASGALLETDRREYLPARFKLVIGDFETTCTIVHRERERVGVAFADSYDMAGEMAHIYATWQGVGTAAHRHH
jgi:hypothetical protein